MTRNIAPLETVHAAGFATHQRASRAQIITSCIAYFEQDCSWQQERVKADVLSLPNSFFTLFTELSALTGRSPFLQEVTECKKPTRCGLQNKL
jgi:hypothetical protein